MFNKLNFHPLHGWEETRNTIQDFTSIMVDIQKGLVAKDSNQTQLALEIHPEGIRTKQMPYPDKKLESIQLNLDFSNHKLIIQNSIGNRQEFYLESITSTNKFYQAIQKSIQSFNLPIKIPPSSMRQDKSTVYESGFATKYFENISSLRRFIHRWKQSHPYTFSNFHFWHTRFQASIEAYGTKSIYYQNDEGTFESPAQISFGFSASDPLIREPYIYANPWPFDSKFTHKPLPSYARWFTESWQGSLIQLSTLVHAPNHQEMLTNYFNAVVQTVAPTLDH